MNNSSPLRAALALILVIFTGLHLSNAYSVLTHEQIIDLTWKNGIRPTLLSRYPNATPAQLKEAHAFAYGGCVIQDQGYYPFGHPLESDLTHYVRTGDFVAALIHDSRNINELAFALGALSHYVGDTIGHPEAVNTSTAVEFPKLEKKYGPSVTYEVSPHAHVRTEFAFDIDQLSKGRIAPSLYFNHIGLRVPTRLIQEAFYETYGLRLNSMLLNQRASYATYRWSVRSFLPTIAYAEVLLHRKQLPPDVPSPEFDQYLKLLSQADFNSGWQKYRKTAGIKTRVIAAIIFILPKVGPLAELSIRGPQPETEEKYIASMNRSIARYDQLLADLTHHPKDSPRLTMHLVNLDLDTGALAIPGTYRLMDTTYAKLLGRIVAVKNPIPATLKRNIQDYYSNPNSPISTKKHLKAWRKVQQELTVLESMPVVPDRDLPPSLTEGKPATPQPSTPEPSTSQPSTPQGN
ncbi:MAG TPA: zinc dependent phospholipase C family protein [Silvibacterium sp.]|nr:zinc dependent phospholipase C family protein [Silvibacterium sp.]